MNLVLKPIEITPTVGLECKPLYVEHVINGKCNHQYNESATTN